MDDEISVKPFMGRDGTPRYKVNWGPCGCFEAYIPEVALTWNPEIPLVRRLKDYLKENPIE